jgi:hypothetical protein
MKEEITAEWARNESENILGERVLKEILDCNNAIVSATQKNITECYVNLFAHKRTIYDLEKRGFKVVQSDSQRDGSTLKINW